MSEIKREVKFRYVFYLYLHDSILNRFKGYQEINIVELENYLSQAHRIPKKIATAMIQEMVIIELFKKERKYFIVPLKSKYDLSKLYREIGLY